MSDPENWVMLHLDKFIVFTNVKLNIEYILVQYHVFLINWVKF